MYKTMAFRCHKQTLILLNIVYMLIGLVLIIVPLVSAVTPVITSWPILGGATASGVFMLLVALAGLYGTIKHHQITLFFYMVILCLIFIILFAFSIGALTITNAQQDRLLRGGWARLGNTTRGEIQSTFDCCGFENKNITSDHPSCVKLPCCSDKAINTDGIHCPSCDTCYSHLRDSGLKKIRQEIAGIGLFFSFTLFLGVYLAFRYRHLKNPRANPSAFL